MVETSPPALTDADLRLLEARGITPEQVASQWHRLRTPPRPIQLERSARVGDGIVRLSPAALPHLLDLGDEAAHTGRVTTFVPASGAATRMFKDLISAAQSTRRPSDLPAARELFSRFDSFPFAEEARRHAGVSGAPRSEEDERRLLRALFTDMELAALPKALVPFHRTARVRTAFEEHLLEGARYTRDASGHCRLHFTVPEEARARFETLLETVRPDVEAVRRGSSLQVTFSVQHPSTDSIGIDADGQLVREADGQLHLRPAGHGALLANLAALDGDLVVIKNIDNVLPDEGGTEVVRWKRILIGYLAELQRELFTHVGRLEAADAPAVHVDAAIAFAERHFARRPAATLTPSQRRTWALGALDRPLRICGMVRNEGEPGGAPFWVRGADGVSLQIVEPSQVDQGDPDALRVLRSATHFNPVDLVCAIRSARGTAFDLTRFIDEDTAFLVRKSLDGRDLVALERPGLWNGSMAGWNTVCVEVPPSTFAPVKTVFDLLRPQHQAAALAAPPAAEHPTGRVLIVDDQPVNQRILTQILRQGGLDADVSADGERALERLRAGDIDLVLLDIMLPGLDGYEVLAAMRRDEASRDIPVIVISSLDEVADKVRGLELGAADYVTKPFAPPDVLARVRAHLRIRKLALSIEQTNRQLRQQQDVLAEELRAAAEIQTALLPHTGTTLNGLRTAALFQPSMAIGGDIFNVVPLADGRIAVFMADVSGHGVASALLTVSLAQWLTSTAGFGRATGDLSPAAVLDGLEREYPFERFGKYFSIVIAVITPETGAVRYSAAGHPEPFVVRRSGAVERLDAGGPIVGMGFGLPFEEGGTTLAPGDRLALYTDGIVEDLSSDGERFGLDPLVARVQATHGEPMTLACSDLGRLLAARRGDAPAADDIALLLIERA